MGKFELTKAALRRGRYESPPAEAPPPYPAHGDDERLDGPSDPRRLSTLSSGSSSVSPSSALGRLSFSSIGHEEKHRLSPSSSPPSSSHHGAASTSGHASGPSSGKDFGAIILGNTDRITTLYLPLSLIPSLSDAIVSAWPSGIQRGEQRPHGWEWKLRGMPWREYIASRRIVFAMLSKLDEAGWEVHSTCNLSRDVLSKDTLFLKRISAEERREKRSFFAVGFYDEDRMRIIDAPEDAVNAFVRITRTWHRGVQEVKDKDPGCLQVKLRGTPFSTHRPEQQALARVLMLDLLGVFDALGYELVTCVDMVTAVGEGGEQPETWFFANKVRSARSASFDASSRV